MTLHRITVRRAGPADEQAIGDLSLAARREMLHLAWSDLGAVLANPTPHVDATRSSPLDVPRTYDLFVGERDGRIGCLWASVIEPASVAQLRALIVRDDWSLPDSLGAMLPCVRHSLRTAGVTTLAFVGVDRWIVDGLAANGFTRTNTVITLQKSDWDVPSRGNRAVIVRPVAPSDCRDILDIDRQAFRPLWRNTALTLSEFMSDPYFCVAELEQQLVGYAHASLIGRHGHLTRIAVHPRYQGWQIGVRLLADAMRFFRRQRVFGVTVNTQQDNARAQRLYRWFGFVPLGQEAEVWTITP